MIEKNFFVSATLLFAAALPYQANATTIVFSFAGPGVSGTVNLTYGAATDSRYPQAFEITGISGTFSDTNNGLNIVNAPIGVLEPVTHDTPDATNFLAPHDFSRFPVAVGLPYNSALTFDNLFYPSGSPPTATDYQAHGGFLDIYGVLFDIGDGRVVNIWSNGDFNGTGTIDYGVAIATHAASLNYVSGGVSVTGPATTVPPTILPAGVVPVYSSANTIEPGSWVSVYGSNLAAVNTVWNGNFPTALGGTSVTIDGKPAYLWFVSPTQINLQAPDDTTTGNVPVVVTTPAGSATSNVTLAPFGPSFSLLDSKHVAGIILRSNGSGAYGGGAYDIIGPTGNSLGYPTAAVKAGDAIEIFGVGFGQTNPPAQAGRVLSGAAPTTNPVTLLINGATVPLTFAGLSNAGLYQFNLIVPAGLGTGDVPIRATVGGVQTPAGVVISLQ